MSNAQSLAMDNSLKVIQNIVTSRNIHYRLINKELLREVKDLCKKALDEQKVEVHSLNVASPWMNLPFYKKIIYNLFGKTALKNKLYISLTVLTVYEPQYITISIMV